MIKTKNKIKHDEDVYPRKDIDIHVSTFRYGKEDKCFLVRSHMKINLESFVSHGVISVEEKNGDISFYRNVHELYGRNK